MSASGFPTKRARCITATSSTARSTAKPRRRKRVRWLMKASKSRRCRCCPRTGTDARRHSAICPKTIHAPRNLLVLAVQPARTDLNEELGLPAAVGAGHRRVLAVLFPRAEAWTGDIGGADRQIE